MGAEWGPSGGEEEGAEDSAPCGAGTTPATQDGKAQRAQGRRPTSGQEPEGTQGVCTAQRRAAPGGRPARVRGPACPSPPLPSQLAGTADHAPRAPGAA